MKRIYNHLILLTALAAISASCLKDLDTEPLDKDEITSANVYQNPASYKQVLAKVYAGLAVSGQQGPHGMPDISGIDEGFSTYIRQYWKAQELPTDEAVIGWNDGTLRDYHDMDWTAAGEFITAMYNRIFYQISLCNEFIRESSDEKLDGRGIGGADKEAIQGYRAEARFMRALSYYHAMDMFGNVPFVTEEDAVGAFFPEQIMRADLFAYIESELKEIETILPAPRSNDYGRADQAAAWALLAKMYLNAEVYIGTAKYNDCVTYCDKVLAAGYTLEPNYQLNFLADNNTSREIIFPVCFDGVHTKTWGGMTFVISAQVGGTMVPGDFGIGGGWAGLRTTKNLVQKFFPDLGGPLKVSAGLTTTQTAYPVVYVPNSSTTTPWDFYSCPILASVNTDEKYEGYGYFKKAGTKFKITRKRNWDNMWGDNQPDGILDPNGKDIVAGDAGYYKINVDLKTLAYTLVKTQWGIVGSATKGGWVTDQDMTYDEKTGLWNAKLELKKGEIKFRANHEPVIEYGDNEADGKLELSGSTIPITIEGTYDISLKLGKPDYTYTVTRLVYDRRALFHTDGQNLEIAQVLDDFTQGYAITKFKNVTSAGVKGSDMSYVDTDFPLFRLADVSLIYAEAVLRGGAGSAGRALDLVNDLRIRAYWDDSGRITAEQLTLDFILDERARELYWEGHRRTDLIRFGKLTGGAYLWPWKGNVKEGVPTDSKYNLFPIPLTDMGANPNLDQNQGYE